jgi:nitrogen fixation/metabolism regulation signal transduction histidine kinase
VADQRIEADLAPIVMEICERAGQRLSGDLIRLETDLESGFKAKIDVAAMRFTIDEIIKNARDAVLGKFGGGGGGSSGKKEIRVRMVRNEGFIEIVVEDSGRGMPIDWMSTRPFDNPYGEREGVGLGIVRDIMSQHGGELRLERRSPNGTGTRAVLRLKSLA